MLCFALGPGRGPWGLDVAISMSINFKYRASGFGMVTCSVADLEDSGSNDVKLTSCLLRVVSQIFMHFSQIPQREYKGRNRPC